MTHHQQAASPSANPDSTPRTAQPDRSLQLTQVVTPLMPELRSPWARVAQASIIFIRNIFRWIFSLDPVEKDVHDPVQKLLNGMRVTSKCRYSASVRLKRLSQYSFLATTLLSLGLILVPLLQNSDIRLAFPPKVLNMLQIFLAVAVLVYSVINATAHYETRSEALNECGDRIKDLIRNLRREVVESKGSGVTVDLAGFNRRYDDISTDAENHNRVDFILATLEMSGDYKYTGLLRLYMFLKAGLLYAIPYILPTLLLIGEGIFIADMLNITKVFTPYLQPVMQG